MDRAAIDRAANNFRTMKPQSPFMSTKPPKPNYAAFESEPLTKQQQQAYESHFSDNSERPGHSQVFESDRKTKETLAPYYPQLQMKEEQSSLLFGKITPIKKETSFQNLSNSKINKLQRDINNLEKMINKEQKPRTASQSIDKYSSKENIQRPLIVVPLEDRLDVVNWLQDIRLLKNNVKDLETKLPTICRDGVICFDLINRISGKEEVLHGAIRKPKNTSQIIQNYRRVYSYLKNFERFNPRTLGCESFIFLDENLFWALLVDIKALFNLASISQNKSSFISNPISNNVTMAPKSDLEKPPESKKAMSISANKLEVTAPSPKRSMTNISPSSYSKIHNSRKNSSAQKIFGTPSKTPKSGLKNASPSRSQLSLSKQNSSSQLISKHVTMEMELFVQNYLKSLPQHQLDLPMRKDPVRNGELLLKLVQKDFSMSNSRTQQDVENQIAHGLALVSMLVEEGSLPMWCLSVTSQDILSLSKPAIGLYFSLLKHFGHSQCPTTNSVALPYKQHEIEQLKRHMLQWTRETCVRIEIHSFPDLVAQIQTGSILCQIVGVVTKKYFDPIHHQPMNQQQCMANIQKALNAVRTLEVGKKFLWKENEIYNGDQLVILGLLEDLKRYHDGEPERQGKNYFIEGPYLNQPIILQQQSDIQSNIQKLPFQLQFSPQQPKQNVPPEKPFSLFNVNRSLNFNFEAVANDKLMKSPKNSSLFDQASIEQEPLRSDIQLIKDWLNQFFEGLGNKIDWRRDNLEEFKDGTIIVKIVHKMEDADMRGTVSQPKTTAACTVNIRKAFSYLKKHASIPVQILFDAERMLTGDKDYILKLLNCLRTLYKNRKLK